MIEQAAFLAQARSDFAVYARLASLDRSEMPECHPLHFLQMATEKIAKAAFMAMGQSFDRHSHVAFSRLPHQLRRRDVARALGWTEFEPFRAFLDRAGPLFRQIDELSPAVGPQVSGGGPKQGPNSEYPWLGRDAAGEVRWKPPCEHSFDLLAKLHRSGDARQLGLLIQRLVDRFDQVFGLA